MPLPAPNATMSPLAVAERGTRRPARSCRPRRPAASVSIIQFDTDAAGHPLHRDLELVVDRRRRRHRVAALVLVAVDDDPERAELAGVVAEGRGAARLGHLEHERGGVGGLVHHPAIRRGWNPRSRPAACGRGAPERAGGAGIATVGDDNGVLRNGNAPGCDGESVRHSLPWYRGRNPDGPRITPLPPGEWPPEMRDACRAAVANPRHPFPARDPDRPKGLNVLGTLARHPELARAFHTFNGHILFATTLTPRMRELLVLRVAAVRGAEYEWAQHVVLAGDAGLSAEEVERIADGADADGWSPLDRALVAAVDELLRDARIGDATWATLAGELDEQQLMDLVFTVGAYDVLAMVFRSFGVELDDDLQRVETILLIERDSCYRSVDDRPGGLTACRTSPSPTRAAGPSTSGSPPSRCTTRTRSRPSTTSSSSEAIFRRTWLNVGRVEQLPRSRQLLHQGARRAPSTSVIVVRDTDGEVRAFHNMCRHRGNKLVWNDYPARGDRAAPAGSSPASTTAGATTSRASSPSCSRRRSSSTSTRPTSVWRRSGSTCGQGFIFVNFDAGRRSRCASTWAGSARGSRATRSTR